MGRVKKMLERVGVRRNDDASSAAKTKGAEQDARYDDLLERAKALGIAVKTISRSKSK